MTVRHLTWSKLAAFAAGLLLAAAALGLDRLTGYCSYDLTWQKRS